MTLPHGKTLCVSLLLFLFTTVSQSGQAVAQSGLPQARVQTQRPIANSVILGGGNHAQTMQRLHVVRQYTLPNLRANPHVMVGEAQLDFTPLLNNAKALPNV